MIHGLFDFSDTITSTATSKTDLVRALQVAPRGVAPRARFRRGACALWLDGPAAEHGGR